MVDKIGSGPDLSGATGRTGGVGSLGASTSARSLHRPDGPAFDQILQQTLHTEPSAGIPGVPGVAEVPSLIGSDLTVLPGTPGVSGLSATDSSTETARVRFSAHAQQRLDQAAIHLGPQALAKLEAAVDKAGQKGGKESLILLDDLAFVVSVQNRTVITAVGANRMADNVFTKIDSVVIAKNDADSTEPGSAM